jgi:baculoviral IAP repeat-containing protein 6
MRPFQYGELDEFQQFHYSKDLVSQGMTSAVQSRIKRIAQEHADISSSLPLSFSSSVWLRVSAERMDAVRFLISGPDDTPYSNGLFLFDAIFPSRYPSEPPKVNLDTTGSGSVRFNPNLYNNGKWK